jgi:O-methyltransferase involved in polyketide biosynthesis
MKEVSKTAFFCCGCRMVDAASPTPIVGDYYAKTLMGADGLQYWKAFENIPRPIISNQVRHYLVENHLRRHLSRDPGVTIVHIGAGLDTRPFRMHGGYWVEIDAPEILDYKEGLLPAASCRNPLQRIPIHFESEQLADKLAPFAKQNNIVFVVEGVLMYLTQAQRVAQLQTLTELFPRHHYICDLMTQEFLQKLAKPFNEILIGQGTSFVDLQQEPAAMFHQAGYRQLSRTSTLDAAIRLGRFGKQGFFMGFMPQRLRDGYAVYEFVYGA